MKRNRYASSLLYGSCARRTKCEFVNHCNSKRKEISIHTIWRMCVRVWEWLYNDHRRPSDSFIYPYTQHIHIAYVKCVNKCIFDWTTQHKICAHFFTFFIIFLRFFLSENLIKIKKFQYFSINQFKIEKIHLSFQLI